MKDNQTAPVEAPANPPLNSQTSPPLRILVVEDDADIRRLNVEVLQRHGYEVDAAEDGSVAWTALELIGYDLLLTDNNMPKVSGIELLMKMRSARMDVPVIMVTGTMPQEEFARQPWLRPAAVLLKPYTVEVMVNTVKKVLREADEISPVSLSEQPAPIPMPVLKNPVRRILAVDEDKDLRLLYADALARPGYQVDVAEDGAAGWNALQTASYDLLITEHDLSKLNGLELVGKLRAVRLDLPVIMVAGQLPVHELARNPALQIAATLEKPFAVEVLLNTVENVLHATDQPPGQMAPPVPRRDTSAGPKFEL